MAQGVGTTKPILGQVDTFGGHFWSPLGYSGPASYVQGGDTISPASFGFNNSIFSLTGSIDGTDTYEAVPLALSVGPNPVWRVVWRVMATGLEVANGVNLSGITVMLNAIGY